VSNHVFHCRVRRSYPRTKLSRFNFNRFLSMFERRALRLAYTIIMLSWVTAHLIGDLSGLIPKSALADEQKANIATISNMAQPCKVTIYDRDGVEHSVQVTASSLYEAVALGLKAVQSSGWTGEPTNLVTVCTVQPGVEHKVRMDKFKLWVESSARGPAEKLSKERVREILK
jgi:hypothetical protein